jgi:hypothetical protein
MTLRGAECGLAPHSPFPLEHGPYIEKNESKVKECALEKEVKLKLNYCCVVGKS